jgi:hypothetical protein
LAGIRIGGAERGVQRIQAIDLLDQIGDVLRGHRQLVRDERGAAVGRQHRLLDLVERGVALGPPARDRADRVAGPVRLEDPLIEVGLEIVLALLEVARGQRELHVDVEDQRCLVGDLPQVADDRGGKHAKRDRQGDKTEEDPGR